MFGFLATVGQDVEHAVETVASGVKNAVGDAVYAAQNDPQLGGLINQTVNNVRADLANAVADAGAGLTSAAARKISPSNAPIVVPLSTTAQHWLIAVVLLVVILIATLLWRRR